VYYATDKIEKAIYTYTPGLSISCLKHRLVWEDDPSEVIDHTHVEENMQVTVTWELTEEMIEKKCKPTDVINPDRPEEVKPAVRRRYLEELNDTNPTIIVSEDLAGE